MKRKPVTPDPANREQPKPRETDRSSGQSSGRRPGLPDWAWLGLLTLAITAGMVAIGLGAFAA